MFLVFFAVGGEPICLLLSTATTSVVLANVSDASLVYSVDISQGVPIDLGQRMSSCEQNTDLMCIALIITTDSNNLTEGEFQAFYNGKITRIGYGKNFYSTAIVQLNVAARLRSC